MKTVTWTRTAALASCAVLTVSLTSCAGEEEKVSANGNKILTVGLSVPESGPIASAGIGQACGFKAYFEASLEIAASMDKIARLQASHVSQANKEAAELMSAAIETGIKATGSEPVSRAAAEPSPPVFARQPRSFGQAVNE